jgi:hypothetical protein
VSDERLRELYAAALATGRTGSGQHPAPEALAALARREGPEATRLAVLDHVMACPACRREFDLVRAVEGAGAAAGAVRRGRPAWLLPTALAATVLVAVGLGEHALRSGEADVPRGGKADIELLQPGPQAPAGATVTFAWRPVSGARRYELELLDSTGNLAAAAATSDTTAEPPAVAALPPGAYRWWIRTTTMDARTLQSELRGLRLRAR